MAVPSVILLHGWTMRGAVFDGLRERLPGEIVCIVPDLPGHGASAHLPPTLDAAAEMLEALVEAASAPPVVVGWSMGAAVVWRYIAAQGAGQLAGLMTVDMSPRVLPGEGWAHGLINQTAESVAATTARMKTDWAGSARAISATMFAKGNDPRPFGRAEALEWILSEDPANMRALWTDLLAFDARPVVPRVNCPWAIAYGAQSRVYGEGAANWLTAHAPQSDLVCFERSGHSAHLEEPEEFAARLRDFLWSI